MEGLTSVDSTGQKPKGYLELMVTYGGEPLRRNRDNKNLLPNLTRQVGTQVNRWATYLVSVRSDIIHRPLEDEVLLSKA